jgi:hypothetical protein
LTHNLIEAVELGATAHFKVEGQWNDDLMKHMSPPRPIPPVAVSQPNRIDLSGRGGQSESLARY